MKLLKRLPLALVALVQLPLAAEAIPVTQGDIILGFRALGAPGVGTHYVVDVGAAKNFRDATGPITITNLNADLESLYGTEWKSRTDIQWAVAGCPNHYGPLDGDPIDSLYLTRAQTVEGVPGTFPNINTSGARGTIASHMANALGIGTAGGLDDSPVSPNNPRASLQPDSLNHDWAAFLLPGGGSELGNSTLDYTWVGGNIEGTPGQTLSLIRYPGTATPSYLGSLKIQGNGDVVFTPAPAANQTYTDWATANVYGQASNLDFDRDGIPNGVEFFTGTPTNAFTPRPAFVSGQITWPRATGRTVTSVYVQTSTNLTTWDNVTANLAGATGPVVYQLPPGQGKLFVRLLVNP